LFAGLNAIGLDRETALRMIEDIALASVPPIRRRAFELLGETPATTREIAQVLKLPTNTARRVLEDLAAQGLAVRERSKGNDGEEKKTGADRWSVDPDWTDWRVKWQATVSA
jgi:predicted HTH transcriptional regulator